MTDYLACASTATGVPITECEVCGQRHPVTRAHCSRCRSWSAFQRSGLCLICSETVTAQRDSGAPILYAEGASNEAAPAGAANTSCSGASPFKMGRTYRDGTP